MGILYFLFSWTLIPLLASFIELLVMLVRGREMFEREYGSMKIRIEKTPATN